MYLFAAVVRPVTLAFFFPFSFLFLGSNENLPDCIGKISAFRLLSVFPLWLAIFSGFVKTWKINEMHLQLNSVRKLMLSRRRSSLSLSQTFTIRDLQEIIKTSSSYLFKITRDQTPSLDVVCSIYTSSPFYRPSHLSLSLAELPNLSIANRSKLFLYHFSLKPFGWRKP